MSLKAKLTALISFLVLLAVLAISALYLWGLVRQALNNVEARGSEQAQQVYSQARGVLAGDLPPGVDPQNAGDLHSFLESALRNDARFNSTVQATVADVPSIDYVSVTDNQLRTLVTSDPGGGDLGFHPAAPFRDLLRAGIYRQLRIIYGPPRVYEIVLPLEFGNQRLDVRVGVSTALLGDYVKPELARALRGSLIAIVLATLLAAIVSFALLQPLEIISASVDRMARGESPGLVLSRTDEWGILSSKLNLLGEQIRGEKAAFVALKDNLNQLFSNLADGLMLFDPENRLVLSTPAVARFLGRPTDSLLHRPAAEVFAGAGALERLLAEAFRNGQSLPWQTLDLGGQAASPRLALSAVFIEERGRRVAGLVTLRDAATRAQLEDQIDVTAKLAAIGRLTSGVAHEVRNPLNSMVLQIELLRTKLAAEGAAQAHLDVLSGEVRRLDRVVRTFLDFTRPVEIHPVETDVEALVQEVFRLAESDALERHCELVLEKNGPLPRVPVDRDLMKQALLNLVLNGCQAMPSGGRLRVAPHPRLRGVEIEIADEGCGIPLEARQRIFSLYYTTKPQGTGVGLAMTFRIIQLHNGTIDFSSEVNHGTTFRVSLPRA